MLIFGAFFSPALRCFPTHLCPCRRRANDGGCGGGGAQCAAMLCCGNIFPFTHAFVFPPEYAAKIRIVLNAPSFFLDNELFFFF